MTFFSLRPRRSDRSLHTFLALVCTALLVPGEGALLAQEAAKPATAAAPAGAGKGDAPKLTPDQLDSLVAPIALYPDPLLAQTLVAATYPLEIVQLQQFLQKNKNLKDKALADAVAKQPWDPAIQSMAAVPDVVKRLSDDIQWTTQLGDAFLDQQADVMDACQRMRKKAQDKGALTTNEQQKVETKVVEQKTVIVVQPSNPEVIYVPTYNPTVVYPPPVYPYPPVYYPPPPPPGTALISFGIGMAVGAAVWGGSCCGCGWGHNDININVNNNFNRNTNVNRSGNDTWQHNSAHRGGAPYSNSATANKYGGTSRGGAQGSRGASTGASDRSASGAGGRGASAGVSDRSAGGAGSRGGAGASPSASSTSRGGGGGGGSGAFGGSGGSSGSSARASSSRGSSSMGSRGGSGGGSRSGGRSGGRR